MTRIRKKIYQADLGHSASYFYDHFTHMKKTPLPVCSVNGVKLTPKANGAIPTFEFPNPNTTEMLFEIFCNPKTANTISTTIIIEYHTKSNCPIAYIFPNGSVFYTGKYVNSQLRREIAYQIRLKKSLLKTGRKH
jgi:hypothetical protein